MLPVTEKSFGHLSGRYHVAGGAPLSDDRDRFFAHAGPAIESHPPDAGPIGFRWFVLYPELRWTYRDMQRETGGDMVNHALFSLQSLAPSRVRGFKPYLWHHHSSILQSSASGTSLCYVRSLSDPYDVRPAERVNFLTMWDINW